MKLWSTERPLSFLAVLLDEIQEWERPVLGRKLREQAFLAKIRQLSPYIEPQEAKSELNYISLTSNNADNFEVDISDSGNLDLNFTLDYGDSLETSNFSFPMMLYLKYKNWRRQYDILLFESSKNNKKAIKRRDIVRDL